MQPQQPPEEEMKHRSIKPKQRSGRLWCLWDRTIAMLLLKPSHHLYHAVEIPPKNLFFTLYLFVLPKQKHLCRIWSVDHILILLRIFSVNSWSLSCQYTMQMKPKPK